MWKVFGDKETHTLYKGAVENLKLNGLDVLTYTDGRKYVGEYKDEIMNG